MEVGKVIKMKEKEIHIWYVSVMLRNGQRIVAKDRNYYESAMDAINHVLSGDWYQFLAIDRDASIAVRTEEIVSLTYGLTGWDLSESHAFYKTYNTGRQE